MNDELEEGTRSETRTDWRGLTKECAQDAREAQGWSGYVAEQRLRKKGTLVGTRKVVNARSPVRQTRGIWGMDDSVPVQGRQIQYVTDTRTVHRSRGFTTVRSRVRQHGAWSTSIPIAYVAETSMNMGREACARAQTCKGYRRWKLEIPSVPRLSNGRLQSLSSKRQQTLWADSVVVLELEQRWGRYKGWKSGILPSQRYRLKVRVVAVAHAEQTWLDSSWSAMTELTVTLVGVAMGACGWTQHRTSVHAEAKDVKLRTAEDSLRQKQLTSARTQPAQRGQETALVRCVSWLSAYNVVRWKIVERAETRM